MGSNMCLLMAWWQLLPVGQDHRGSLSFATSTLYLGLAVACLLAFPSLGMKTVAVSIYTSGTPATLALTLNRGVCFWCWQFIAIVHPTSGIHKGSFWQFVSAGSWRVPAAIISCLSGRPMLFPGLLPLCHISPLRVSL